MDARLDMIVNMVGIKMFAVDVNLGTSVVSFLANTMKVKINATLKRGCIDGFKSFGQWVSR